MKILTDTHTHTVASSHAYSTLEENIKAAKSAKLELLCMTDHGPSMEDAPHPWHFENLKTLPPVLYGMKMLYGTEANIVGTGGELDIPENILKNLGIVLASLHRITYKNQSDKDHTKTWLNVLKNPYVDILGHPGRGGFDFDKDTVIKAAKDADVCIEVNRFTIENPVQREVCREIILCCKKYGTKIAVGSDAHISAHIGMLGDAAKLLSDCDFPEELVINRNADTLIEHLKNKNKYFDYSF